MIVAVAVVDGLIGKELNLPGVGGFFKASLVVVEPEANHGKCYDHIALVLMTLLTVYKK